MYEYEVCARPLIVIVILILTISNIIEDARKYDIRSRKMYGGMVALQCGALHDRSNLLMW